MANALFDAGRNAFLTGSIDWVNDTINCALVDTTTYTLSDKLATETNMSNIRAHVVAEVALAGKSATGGVADANDVVFTAVTGNEAEALVFYKVVTNDADAILIAYIDTATGLPITPNSGDISVVWDDGANKIFKL